MPPTDAASTAASQILNAPLIQVIGLVLVIIAVVVPLLVAVMWRQQRVQEKGNDILLKVVEARAEDRIDAKRQLDAIEEMAKAQTLTLEETRARRAQIDSIGARMDVRFDELRDILLEHGEGNVITNSRLTSLAEAFDDFSKQIAANAQGSLERHGELITRLEEMKRRLFDALTPTEDTPNES